MVQAVRRVVAEVPLGAAKARLFFVLAAAAASPRQVKTSEGDGLEQPGLRIFRGLASSPEGDERFLDGIIGQAVVLEDAPRQPLHPAEQRADRPGQMFEGVGVLGLGHQGAWEVADPSLGSGHGAARSQRHVSDPHRGPCGDSCRREDEPGPVRGPNASRGDSTLG